MIILDLGGGGVHHNDIGRVRETIDSIVDINRKRDIVIKFQLHPQWGDKDAMRPHVFDWAYRYATDLKFDVTASVFSYSDYHFLSAYNTPFIKWANQVYIRVQFEDIIEADDIISVPDSNTFFRLMVNGYDKLLCCVSEYPASYNDYVSKFDREELQTGISDHTGSLELYSQYEPSIYEAHYMLPEYDDKKRGYVLGPKDLQDLENLRREE